MLFWFFFKHIDLITSWAKRYRQHLLFFWDSWILNFCIRPPAQTRPLAPPMAEPNHFFLKPKHVYYPNLTGNSAQIGMHYEILAHFQWQVIPRHGIDANLQIWLFVISPWLFMLEVQFLCLILCFSGQGIC